MLLSDLFIQGVDKLPALKLRLPQGLSALVPVTDDTLMDVLSALLYAEGFDPQSPFSTMAAETVRVGCVLVKEDGTSYRVIRDLKSGSAQLARAEGGQYQPIASGGREVSQLLRTELHVPAKDVFDAVFVLNARQFPAAAAPTPPQPVLMAQPLSLMMPEPLVKRPNHAIHQELEALKKQREAFADTERLEFELDGLQKRRFAFDALAEKRRGLHERVASIDRELSQTAALAELPAEFPALVQSFAKQKQKYDDDRTKVAEEIAKMEADGAPSKPAPIFSDKKFLGGVAAGAVILLGAAFLEGDLRLVGLLDIAPFGFAAMQALGAVNELEMSDRYFARLKALKERLKKIADKFERDAAIVRGAIKRFGVESADEVVAAIGRRQALETELKRIKGAISDFEQTEGRALEGDELKGLNQRISEVEAALLGAGNSGGDTRDIDRRIQELEAEQTGMTMPALSQLGAPAPVVASAGEPVEAAAFLSVLRALMDASGQDQATVAKELATRAAAYAGRLVSRPNTALAIDERGAATFGGAGFGGLPAGEQRALYLSVRLAAYELSTRLHAFPFWLDRLAAVSGLPHEALPAFYSHLAKKSQVFVLGSEGPATSGVEQRVAIA